MHKQSICRWLETSWRWCDVTVMKCEQEVAGQCLIYTISLCIISYMVPHCSHDVHICLFTCMTEWQVHVTTDPERNQNITVVVSNQSFPATVAAPLEQPDYTFCVQYNGIPPASSEVTFSCSGGPITARYVYVYLPGLSNPLTLGEVEVNAPGKLRDMRIFRLI